MTANCHICQGKGQQGNTLRTYLYKNPLKDQELLLCWKCYLVLGEKCGNTGPTKVIDKANI